MHSPSGCLVSGANASKSEPVRMGVCVGNPSFGGITVSGLDGSRTRVRSTIPCPSTSVVCYLTFPLPIENKHPSGFSSFIIRPHAQSFACVVSHIVEAWVLMCECTRSDYCQIRQRMLNYYLQRLILIWPFNALPYDSLLQLHDPRRNLY